jgi:hypothetical protein
MVYPGSAGIAIMGASTWGTSITDNHTHWDAAYSDLGGARPASDVYAWAKAATKPTYSYSDVGALAVGGTAANSSQLGSHNAAYFQTALNGTGFVKMSGTSLSYDNNSYCKTDGSNATSEYSWGINITGASANSALLENHSSSYFQTALSGTGFVKASGSSISYDNSTYLASESDPVFVAHVAHNVTQGLMDNWSSAYSFTNASGFGSQNDVELYVAQTSGGSPTYRLKLVSTELGGYTYYLLKTQ